jgi:signal transduction histidine kinase/CheY-like chemotaxis protein/HAMP domain-containing protein
MNDFIRRRWGGLGVVGKLSVASGAMLALVFFVGLVAVVALDYLWARTDDVIQHTVQVQRLALQVRGGLLRTHRSEKDFFHSWPTVGLTEARNRHATPCRVALDSVMHDSRLLQDALHRVERSGLEVSAADRSVEVITMAVADYSDAFERGVGIATQLGHEETGLRARMEALANRAEERLAALEKDEMLVLFRNFRHVVLRFALIRKLEDMKTARSLLAGIHAAVNRDAIMAPQDRKELAAMFARLQSGLSQAHEAEEELIRCMAVFDRQMERVEPVVDRLVKATTGQVRGARNHIDEAMGIAVGAVGFALLLCLVLAVFIYRMLYRSLGKNVLLLSRAANELSLGNMGTRVDIDSPDEFGRLGDTLNGMAERMDRMVNSLEKEAAVASDRLLEAIESIPDGFALYDQQDRLVLCNSNYMDIERGTLDMFGPGDRFRDILRCNVARGMYRDAVGDEEAWLEHRMRLHANPGEPFEQRLTDGRCLQIREYRTRLGEIVCIVSDISQRKQAEEELFSFNADLEQAVRERTKVLVSKTRELQRANRRLRELDEMKSNFLSTVSHELRTPLTSLLGFSRLIGRDFCREFVPRADDAKSRSKAERIRSNLEIINSEGARLTRLINDVLDLSRIETGKVSWRDQDVPLPELIRHAADAVSGQFAEKPHVELVLGALDGLPIVHVDPDRMQQVFINLLNNAAKFTEYGSVTIQGDVDARGFAHVQVRDTGIGISADHIDMIFDKFQQANEGDTLRTPQGGSGLGLAISRQIVERYRGHIWAESEPGNGTVMHVALPATRMAGVCDSETDGPLHTVLVVDDDPAMLQLLGAILRDAGYAVETAASGEDGLKKARQLRPDLISMDLLMPGMGGLEAVSRIRGDSLLASIPVLVATVDTSADDAVCAIGADALVRKPLNRDEYLGAVRFLLGQGELKGPVLALGREEEHRFDCGNVRYCAGEDLPPGTLRGFDGTVVVPESVEMPSELLEDSRESRVRLVVMPGASLSG